MVAMMVQLVAAHLAHLTVLLLAEQKARQMAELKVQGLAVHLAKHWDERMESNSALKTAGLLAKQTVLQRAIPWDTMTAGL